MARMVGSKEFRFSAAHRLPSHDGPCREMHGHNYTLVVSVEGELDEKSGMVMDFYEIEKIVNGKILSRLDHVCLNDIIPNPTCENLSIWIWGQLKGEVACLHEVKLYERPDSFVTYRGD